MLIFANHFNSNVFHLICLMEKDHVFLCRALEIAVQGVNEGGGPFGALIAKDGRIIAESWNNVVLSADPTAHAEINAIRKACEILGTHDLSDCILYSSCEPCPMCLGAVYWAGIKKVVYAFDRKEAEKAGFSDKFIYDEIMLEPASRHVRFLHIPGCCNGPDPFRKWDENENKIPY